jgi:hypothetical protein
MRWTDRVPSHANTTGIDGAKTGTVRGVLSIGPNMRYRDFAQAPVA